MVQGSIEAIPAHRERHAGDAPRVVDACGAARAARGDDLGGAAPGSTVDSEGVRAVGAVSYHAGAVAVYVLDGAADAITTCTGSVKPVIGASDELSYHASGGSGATCDAPRVVKLDVGGRLRSGDAVQL